MKNLDKKRLIELCETDKVKPSISGDSLVAECTLCDNSLVELTLKLADNTFYTLPEFSIDLEQYPRLKGLPHVGQSGVICASDATISHPNPKEPEKCASEVLERAITVLNDGILGINYGDYADELKAYWNLESSYFGYICDELPADSQTVYVAFAKVKKKDVPCFAADERTAISFARRLGQHGNHTPKASPCLLLALAHPLSFPLPVTYKEWDDEIGRSGKRFLSRYRTFLSESEKQTVFVVLSVPSGNGRAMVCFSQLRTPRHKGFRANSRCHERALKNPSYSTKTVCKYRLEDASQERLFSRGGRGRLLHEACGIIGCGSLGSHLAEVLARSGVGSFLLIDSEALSLDNIARHTCGFNQIGRNKAQAVGENLAEANPNIECTPIACDANDIIDNHLQVLSECQALFVTAADAPLEYHCVSALCSGALSCPVIIMWLEPFALFAHAIVLNKPQDIFEDLFDENFSFLHHAVSNAKSFLRREAGCQSSYMPYSGLDVQIFLLRFLEIWGSGIEMKEERNYHFVWAGNRSSARMLNAEVAPEYAWMDDYTYYLERID